MAGTLMTGAAADRAGWAPDRGQFRVSPGYPGRLVEQCRLPDGTPVLIRPITGEDRFRHWRFVCSLSSQTRYQRLLSARRLLPDELHRLVQVDYRSEMALIAIAQVPDGEREVGVARYVRIAEPPARSNSGDGGIGAEASNRGVAGVVRGDDGIRGDVLRGDRGIGSDRGIHGDTADFAIVVADAWQRRGLGAALLRSLGRAAAANSIWRLTGITLATNVPMLRLARRLGVELAPEAGDWTVKRLTWQVAPVQTVVQ